MADAPAPPRRNRRGSGAVTLHDVARLAGVAPITASRALNTPQQVSEDVRRRVDDAVAKTGYVPNRMAGALASSRSRLVAAVVPTISGPVFGPTIEALSETLAAAGYQLMLGQTGYESGASGEGQGQREDALLDAIVGRRPDGVVLTGILHSARGRQRLLAAALPVVETWDLTETPIDMLVGFSHAEVGRAVADFLLAGGRRRLAVIAGADERAARRTAAFVAAARAGPQDEVPVFCVPAPTTLRSGREGLAHLLQRRGGVDAVFCSSDLLALGVLTEARARGLAVPQDVAVVGFGDLGFAADTLPALTTVRINGAAIGEQAARFIVDRIEGRPVGPRVVDIGFSIARRDSA
ncbi:MAG: LacI family DNA-binding transcriptional regulator [Proteobacteria bacterium]|nr:LacI family DNA-binding transcriptional regulator [Pseudomonadota bacterium]